MQHWTLWGTSTNKGSDEAGEMMRCFLERRILLETFLVENLSECTLHVVVQCRIRFRRLSYSARSSQSKSRTLQSNSRSVAAWRDMLRPSRAIQQYTSLVEPCHPPSSRSDPESVSYDDIGRAKWSGRSVAYSPLIAQTHKNHFQH